MLQRKSIMLQRRDYLKNKLLKINWKELIKLVKMSIKNLNQCLMKLKKKLDSRKKLYLRNHRNYSN